MDLTYKTYSQIVKLAFSEEVERVQEYLYYIEAGEDVMDDKPWTGAVDHPPSFEEVKALLPKLEDYTQAEVASMVDDPNAEEEDLETLSDAIRLAWMES